MKRFFIFLFVIALLGAGTYFGYNHFVKSKQDESGVDKPKDLFYTVKQGSMIIGINQGGNINSSKKHKLGLEAAFQTKLIWVVDENKKVKKGEDLAKFETEELELRIEDYQLELDNLKKELEINLEEKKMLLSSNKAELKAASDQLTTAEDALRKYCKFDRHKDKENHNVKVRNSQKAFEEAETRYHDYKKQLSSMSFKDKASEDKANKELKDLKRKMDNERTSYKNAALDRKVFKRYTYPQKFKDLTNKLEQSKLNYQKIKIRNASKVIQKDKAINNLETKIRKKKKVLEDHESYMPLMKIAAPVDGVVIYGDPDRRWGKVTVKIGMDIRRRQVLLTIPDMSKLIVEFDLPEQYRSKVKVGDKVVVTPDSLKTVKVNGKISKIASLPVNQIHWDRNSPKIYKTTVELDKQNPKLVAGMSVKLEVISKVLKDVLYVPIESVFEEGGKYFVYKLSLLKKPVVQYIKIGSANDNYVEIKEGLKKDDKVYLYRPFQRKTEM